MVQELAPLEVHQGHLGLYLIVMLKQHIAHLMGLITPLYNTVWLG